MKKLFLFLTILIAGITANAQYSPSNNLNYVKLLKDPPTGVTNDSIVVFDGTDKFLKKIPSSGFEKQTNKTSIITGYDTAKYPNEKAVHDALDLKLNISDLPTNLTLYPTTTASDVGGYVVMVTDIHDVRFDDPAVDVSTPTITTTAQLVSQRISDPGVLIGQPGVFNITTFGNIRRLSGTGTATFYFEVYHRDAAGIETLIGQSSNSAVVSSSSYMEFTASLNWDDGDFIATDRIVIKTYANRIPGNSDPVYQFQFGGSQPVRTLLPVPFSVVDAGYEVKTNKQNSLAVDGTGTKYPTVDAVNAALPVTYSTVVYVNDVSPITATIFDDVNPPVSNDPLLDNDTSNLYIGTDASTWVYNGSTYVTKVVPATSNFNLYNTSVDAGNNKTSIIERYGAIASQSGNIVRKNGSDSVLGGGYFSFYNNGITNGNTFQLNASNGLDLWNFASSTWNKRFTFSSDGYLTATNGQLIGGTGTVNYVPKFTGSGTLGNSLAYGNDEGLVVKNTNSEAYSAFSVFNDNGLSSLQFGVYNSTNGNANKGFLFAGGNTAEFGIYVASTKAINFPSSGGIQIGSSNNATINNGIIGNNTFFQFATNGENRVKIDSTGELLVNTTTNNGVDKLQVNGSVSATSYNFSGTTISEPDNQSNYTQIKIQPTAGNKDAVFQFAPSGSATNSVLEFYSSTTLTGMHRGIIKNSNGNLQFGSDGANMPISFIMSGVPKVVIATDGGITATSYTGPATLTGTPTAPTATAGTNTTQIASTAFVQSEKQNLQNVIEIGSQVYFDDENSGVDFLTGTENNRRFIVTTGSPTSTSSLSISNGSIQMNADSASYLNRIDIIDSYFRINRTNVSNGLSTEIFIAEPQSSTSINIPAKTIAGTYTLVVNPNTPYTVSTLPTGQLNDIAVVTDALAPTYLGILTGGGSVVSPVWHNGTTWVSR